MDIKLTYDNIQKAAEEIALDYRSKNDVPQLPGDGVLNKYKQVLDSDLVSVVEKVNDHVSQFEPDGGHGFEHLEYVAKMAGYFAENECDSKNITGEEKNRIIKMAMMAGLFHDVDRHLGFEEEHMEEAEKTTREILTELNTDDETTNKVAVAVRNHDHFDFSSDDLETQIIFGAVFDPDHFRWGLEREDTFWRMKEKRGMLPEEVIHYYQYLYPLRDAWKTKMGKEIGTKYIDFGLAIALEVEKRFG